MSEARVSLASSTTERLLAGAIGKDLGLTSEDLQLGLALARQRLMRGAKPEALRLYVALVLCEPMNAEFQSGLANCALELGDYHLALQAASVVIALEPSNCRGYFFSGRACLALGYRDEAKEDLSDAVEFGRAAKDSLVVTQGEKLLRLLEASGT